MKDFLNFHGYLTKLNKSDLQDLYFKLENYRLRYRNNIDLNSNLSFGVEIEFDNVVLNAVRSFLLNYDDLKDWLVVEDISVGSFNKNGEIVGGEISSAILHDLESDWNKLSQIMKFLKRLKATANQKTSFHVHVGAQIFGEDLEYVKRFIKLWCIFEDIIFRFSYGKNLFARKRILDFAQPIFPIYKENWYNDSSFFDNITDIKNFISGKDKAVNFNNYHKLTNEVEVNNTIEFRCANGTLNQAIAQNFINFYIKFILYSTSDNYNDSLVDYLFSKTNVKDLSAYSSLNINKALVLVDLIFDNTLDKINFLKQYFKKEDFALIRHLNL